jgi:hypothetical protein
MNAVTASKANLWDRIATGLYLPADDGNWNYFPRGYSGLGYRIDEATKQSLIELQTEWRRQGLPLALLALAGLIAFGAIITRAVPELVPFARSFPIPLAAWGILFLMMAFPLAIVNRRQSNEILKQRTLATVLLSPAEARARDIEFIRSCSLFGTPWSNLMGVPAVLAIADRAVEAFKSGSSVGYVDSAVLTVAALAATVAFGRPACRLIAYRLEEMGR